ncbi:IS1/IS1595 family N-terminal zinc-binding domain-containing protein [Allochromatium warmingii]
MLGKQRYRCKECGHQFALNPAKEQISDDKKMLFDCYWSVSR